MSDSRQMMYFQFTNGDTQLTFALGNREQPRAVGAGAVGQSTTSGAIKRPACARNNCSSSMASMSTMSNSRNSTLALMPPPKTSQINKSTACPSGRTICERSCTAPCNPSRNATVLARTVSPVPPNYQSFKAPHSVNNNNSTITNTTQLNSTRKESLSSTMLPAYEPTILAGNTSVSKPCILPNATGINTSYNQTLSKTYLRKTSFNNVTANSTRRQ